MGRKFKMVLTLGAIISVPMILMSVIAYVFNIVESKAYGLLSILVLVATIVLVQRYYRISFYKGFASYSKILGGTILMVLMSALIICVYTYLFYKFIAPEQLVLLLEKQEVALYNQNMSASEIDQAVEVLENYVFTPFMMSITTFFMTIIQGILIALVSSIFTRKKADPFEEAMNGIGDE